MRREHWRIVTQWVRASVMEDVTFLQIRYTAMCIYVYTCIYTHACAYVYCFSGYHDNTSFKVIRLFSCLVSCPMMMIIDPVITNSIN